MTRRDKGKCCLLLAIHALQILVATACGRVSPAGETLEPAWLDQVSAPVIGSEEEVDALWQSKPRCCGEEMVKDARIFYKACSDAIARYPDREHLVVKCLWLMDLALDTPGRLAIHERLLNEHFSYRGSLRRCVNCAYGDIVSRTAADAAHIYESQGRAHDAVALLERVLDERGSETSPWIRIEIFTQLGTLYQRYGVTDVRIRRMVTAHDEFEAMRSNETIAARWNDFSNVYKKVVESTKR